MTQDADTRRDARPATQDADTRPGYRRPARRALLVLLLILAVAAVFWLILPFLVAQLPTGP